MEDDVNVFDAINNFAKLRGYYKRYNTPALNWYRREISQLGNINKLKVLGDNIRYQHTVPSVGQFCLFFYDPKYKKTLPYYDAFPLTLMLPSTKYEFAGLNFHYLDPMNRLKLLQAIISIQEGNFTEAKKLNATYELIKGTTDLYKPTYHAYLTKHIKSRVVFIPLESVVPAVFLPIASFKKKAQSTVWRESKKLI